MRNKTNIETIDKTQPVILETTIDGIGNFAIQGMYDEVVPYITSHVEAVESPARVKTDKVPSNGIKTITGIRADVTAILYDLTNNTRFHTALKEQRQLRKDLHMAQSLGLLTVPVCAKHRKALEEVKSIR